MKIGDKVRVVNSGSVFSTYQEMADVMGLSKFRNAQDFNTAGLVYGDILTISNIQTHLQNSKAVLIGGYCKRSNEDFIIGILGVETVETKPLPKPKPLSEYKEDSQNRALLSYLMRGKSITAGEAFELFGITQLAARITELQVDGYVFTRTRIIPEDNGKKWYYEYSLDKGK